MWEKENEKNLKTCHWHRLADILGRTIPQTQGGDGDCSHGFLPRSFPPCWPAFPEELGLRGTAPGWRCKWPGLGAHSADIKPAQELRKGWVTTGSKQKIWSQRLTWALDVVSRKQRRFPNPSQERHNLICSFKMEAVHCRTTWSSCTQNSQQHPSLHFSVTISSLKLFSVDVATGWRSNYREKCSIHFYMIFLLKPLERDGCLEYIIKTGKMGPCCPLQLKITMTKGVFIFSQFFAEHSWYIWLDLYFYAAHMFTFLLSCIEYMSRIPGKSMFTPMNVFYTWLIHKYKYRAACKKIGVFCEMVCG